MLPEYHPDPKRNQTSRYHLSDLTGRVKTDEEEKRERERRHAKKRGRKRKRTRAIRQASPESLRALQEAYNKR